MAFQWRGHYESTIHTRGPCNEPAKTVRAYLPLRSRLSGLPARFIPMGFQT